MHAHKSLSSETWLLLKVAELETWLVCGHWERLCHPLLTQYLNRCLVSDSSANAAASTEEACEDRLAAL